MADVITRFRLETTQYDSKLRYASQELANFTREAEKAGSEFDKFAKDNIEAARSLGSIDVSATNAKDAVKELVSAYNDSARAYNSLSKEQQSGEFGQALAQSLDTLKGRISDAKQELYGIGGGAKNAEVSFESLTGKLSFTVDTVKLFSFGVEAAKVALEVAKDAFFSTEKGIDEWGRTVEGAKGAYEVFLDTLNHGNWSDFFRNLQTAVQGGRDLYDVLDRLGSIKSNNQAAIAIVQAQIQELRVAKQQGKNVDDQIKAAEQRLKRLRGEQIAAGKEAGSVSAETVVRNAINSMKGASVSDKSIQAAIDGIMKNGQTEFDKYRQTVAKYESWSKAQSTRDVYLQNSAGISSKVGTEQYFEIGKLSIEQQRQYKIAKAITDEETNIQKGISIYAQAVQEGASAAREEFRNNRYALQGTGGNNRGGGSASSKELTELQQNQKEISYLTAEYQRLGDVIKKANGDALKAAQDRQIEIKKDISSLQARNEELKKWSDEAQGKVIKIEGLSALHKQLKELQQAQSDSTDTTSWIAYQIEIEKVTRDIAHMKGELLKGETATITFDVDDSKLEALKSMMPKNQTYKVESVEGRKQLSEWTPDQFYKVNAVEGEGIDLAKPKDQTYTITAIADTTEASRQLLELAQKYDNTTIHYEAKVNVQADDTLLTTDNLSSKMSELRKKIGSVEIGSIDYGKLTGNMADLTALSTLIKKSVENGLTDIDFTPLWSDITANIDIDDDAIQAKVDEINVKLAEIGKDPIKIDVNTGNIVKEGEKTKQSWSAAQAAVQSVGSALQGLEDPSAKIAGIVGQAIASIALGFAQATAKDSKFGVLGWVAAITGGIGTMLATISSIKSATAGSYEQGGIVPGNSFHGDHLMASVNSGELILTRSQQNSIASQLDGANNLGNLTLEAVMYGEDIRFALNNNSRRRGRGEYVTTRRM